MSSTTPEPTPVAATEPAAVATLGPAEVEFQRQLSLHKAYIERVKQDGTHSLNRFDGLEEPSELFYSCCPDLLHERHQAVHDTGVMILRHAHEQMNMLHHMIKSDTANPMHKEMMAIGCDLEPCVCSHGHSTCYAGCGCLKPGQALCAQCQHEYVNEHLPRAAPAKST